MDQRFLSYGRQSIDESDVEAVVRALHSDALTCGREVDLFEEDFARRAGAKYAISFANATGALHCAMLAAGIGKGDRVLTSPLTFLSSANCAAFVGATPDFVDVDPQTRLFSADSLKNRLTRDVKAVVPVDLAGQSCDMPAIAKIARKHGAFIIEDACHATGGFLFDEGKTYPIGGHPWADMTVFSFHPVKTMTCGEGGMITTNDERLANRARLFRGHGIVRQIDDCVGLGTNDPAFMEKGAWYYEMQELGYNYRLTDIQCALGRSQLGKLSRFIDRRREIVARYNAGLIGISCLAIPQCALPARPESTSWHLYEVQIDFDQLGKTRSQVMNELKERGIGSQVLYIPVHLQPWYRRMYGYGQGKCPIAEAIYPQLLSLPLWPDLTDKEVDYVIANLIDILT